MLRQVTIGNGNKHAVFYVRSKKQGMAFMILTSYADTIRDATGVAKRWAHAPGNVSFPYTLDRKYE